MKILLQIFKTFSRKEYCIFVTACLIFILSFIFVAANFINQHTRLTPVVGGEYIEGVIGQPSFVNPVLAANGSPDQDLTELIFSSFLDLAENYKMDESGQIWNVRLKENILWDDKELITSDDVIFTIKTIQDPDSHSPDFSVWQGVVAERVSQREVKLILPETYVFFKNTLKELKVIPKHIFWSIPVANLKLSDFNLEPIGSGPFKFSSFSKERSGFISEYQLVRNENYFGEKPYLEKISFKFYQDEEKLIKAFNSGAISGFGGLSQKDLRRITITHQAFEIMLPRYYAIFFNPYSQEIFEEKNVRTALDYAVNRKSLIEQVFENRAVSVEGPLVLGMNGYAAEVYPQENFSLDKAAEILEAAGWQLNNEGIREKSFGKNKELKKLKFELTVPQIPFLVEAAEFIRDDWSKIGIKLNLAVRSTQEMNDEVIKTRNYQMIIFGNIFGSVDTPDLYSFWHSSERFYPGLNLALYENKTVDVLIQSIRKSLNDARRQSDLASLQSLIVQDCPAIFLFSPHYLYITRSWLKGFGGEFISSTNQRFQSVEKWYVKSARVFK